MTWARARFGVARLEDLDARADELATAYLAVKMVEGKASGAPYSAWTLALDRTALRMFHGRRDLAAGVALPRRRREEIRHNRAPSAHARGYVDEARHADLVAFLRGSGLRRDEATRLRAGDVAVELDGEGRAAGATVRVRQGKGGRAREVRYLGDPDRLAALVGGKRPEDRAFVRVHTALQAHRLRRAFAQDLYRRLSGRDLPPAEGRLPRGSYDPAAVDEVSRQLGHSRRDVVLAHYLR